MKKVLPIVMSLSLAAGLATTGFGQAAKTTKKKEATPEQINVRMPNGEVINAVKVPAPKKKGLPDGVEIIVKGKVTEELDERINVKQLVIVAETGDKYLPSNAPYVNMLRQKGIGKTVKLKGLNIAKTSFKDYPAIYIKDVLDMK